ncbi:MAG TPA: hypothetical protein VG871_20675, partial [Vicinamibacterales bacterium]|nr:hypothetical protein [Vicinamibacterales bacterium]
MRLAWFRPATHNRDQNRAFDALRADLAATHEIDVVDEAAAHQFVWRHARRPYDVCVYDLDDTSAHQYLWPYLLHVPGVVVLRSLSLRESRSRRLARERRDADLRTELAFGGPRLLRAPLAASRLAVVFDTDVARALEREFPGMPVAVAPIGIPARDDVAMKDDVGMKSDLETRDAANPKASLHATPATAAPVRFGIIEGAEGLVDRAARRARAAGATFEIVRGQSWDDTLAHCDVALALGWPPDGAAPSAALVAMAAGRPCIVFETGVTAVWPALDPQNWQPRDPFPAAPPAVVSLDPRDEEHSLMLALRRLSADAALR